MNNKLLCKLVLSAIVMNNNKVLLLKRSDNEDSYPGYWELPGGKREPRESVEYGLIRECEEETGITVQDFSFVNSFLYGENPESVQLNFLTLVHGKSPVVKLCSDHVAYTWLGINELHKYKISEETKKVVIRAFNML